MSFSVALFGADKMTLDELIAKHQASIGTPAARAAAKGRSVIGNFEVEVIQGGSGQAGGQAGVISSGHMMKVLMRCNSATYPGERFWFNGKKQIVPVADAASRTILSDFIYRNDSILRDGLFSGTISTAWPLLDPSARGAKMIYEGLKHVDGRELHEVTYRPQKAPSELEVKLYFEPDTFRHVMTQYRYEIAPYMNVVPGMRGDANVTTHRSTTYYTVEERFSDFQTDDGVTTPRAWEVRYTVQPVSAISMKWTMKLGRPTTNPNFDPKDVFPDE